MKQTILFFLLILIIRNTTYAQCKPDIENKDKFSTSNNMLWFEQVYDTPLMSNSTSDVSINMSIGIQDTTYFLQVEIMKIESSLENASFESKLKADKGATVQLAFKRGKPIGGQVDNFTNNTAMNNMFKKLVTTVRLSLYIRKQDLPDMKKVLIEGGPLDGIRIRFSDGTTIEKAIKEKRGNKMLDKFKCFFDFIEANK